MGNRPPWDRVIVAATDDGFREFFPMVCEAWARFFPWTKISLALVTDRDESDLAIERLALFGEVSLFRPIAGVPNPNHAKIARYILAARYPDEACFIHDVDSVPLQNGYAISIAEKWDRGESLLAYSANVYKGEHLGKWWAQYQLAWGKTFGAIVNPNGLADDRIIPDLCGMNNIDRYEDPSNPPDQFSDESMIRALVLAGHVPVIHVPRKCDIMIEWVDRSWWGFDRVRLFTGRYLHCNMLRPMAENWGKLEPIAEYIYGRKVTLEEVAG